MPTPDTLVQALWRYTAGQVGVYLPVPVPFDPTALENTVATILETVNSLIPHVDALEQRDAIHSQALIDLKAQVADLESKLDDASPEVVAAVDAIKARLDKVDEDAPLPPPPDVVVGPPEEPPA
jgi:hypothetical protein